MKIFPHKAAKFTKIHSSLCSWCLCVINSFLHRKPKSVHHGDTEDAEGKHSPLFFFLSKSVFRLPLSAFLLLLSLAPASGAVIYVDASAVGANTGTNWADAYTNLQTALSAAVSNHKIWGAQAANHKEVCYVSNQGAF